MSIRLPLSGVDVVEFGQYIVGPATAQLLRDQGARVTKVESPQGDPARRGGLVVGAAFESYNRGKAMVSLDLAEPDDRDRALQLCDAADVVIANLRPGVMEKFGLAPETLMSRNQGLIVASISGFGHDNPLAARPGLDGAAQAESGLMWVNGEKGGDPLRVGVPVVDVATAYVTAQAICAALFEKLRSGEGARISPNLMDVAIHLQGAYWRALSDDYEPIRCGNGLPGSAPSADVLRVKDGFIVVSAYADAHWSAFCRALGAESMYGDPANATPETRAERRPELLQEIELLLANLTRDQACELLTRAGVVAGAVRRYPEVLEVRGVNNVGPLIPNGSEPKDGVTVGVPCAWGGVAGCSDPPRGVGADNEVVFGNRIAGRE